MGNKPSFEAKEQFWPDPADDGNPIESTALKCAARKANAADYFKAGKIDKNVLSSKIDRKMHFHEQVHLGNCIDEVEVAGRGTKFMKSINFPTVIVKLRKGNLKKSTMYYVILEIETEEYKHKVVPAIMFSNPHCHGKTKLAELLPLSFKKCSNCIIRPTPMMARKRYRNIIRKGLSYKVISLIPGRGFHGLREHSWNKYDIRETCLRNVFRRLLEKDINQMLLLLAKEIFPFKRTIAPHNCMQKILTASQITFRPRTVDIGKEKNLPVDPNEYNGELYFKGSVYPLNELAEYTSISQII